MSGRKYVSRDGRENVSVARNNKVGNLNTGNQDVGSDNINKAVYTRDIIFRVKPELLS